VRHRQLHRAAIHASEHALMTPRPNRLHHSMRKGKGSTLVPPPSPDSSPASSKYQSTTSPASALADQWGPLTRGPVDLHISVYSFQENDAKFDKSYLEF
jgi:hypothetical protein